VSTEGKRYTQPGSPASRLEAFFRDNPDEELSYTDALAKLGMRPNQLRALRMAVCRASREGELESLYVIRRPKGARTVTCPICETAIKVLA
jgi:hypothetical protein